MRLIEAAAPLVTQLRAANMLRTSPPASFFGVSLIVLMTDLAASALLVLLGTLYLRRRAAA
jgi:hypothetical protein